MLLLVNVYSEQIFRVWTGADEITKFYLNEHDFEIKRMFNYTCMLLLVKENLEQLDRALGEY
jgi:hypothetical protein